MQECRVVQECETFFTFAEYSVSAIDTAGLGSHIGLNLNERDRP